MDSMIQLFLTFFFVFFIRRYDHLLKFLFKKQQLFPVGTKADKLQTLITLIYLVEKLKK